MASSSKAPYSSPVPTQQSDTVTPLKSLDTPLEDMLQKVSNSSGRWPKPLLEQAAQIKKPSKAVVGRILSDDELRRSSRAKA